jgi:hypothetical protein
MHSAQSSLIKGDLGQGERGASSPRPSGLPPDVPEREPDEQPRHGPRGPRTPYPVDDPGVADPTGPGSEPDYVPGRPSELPQRM